MSQLSTVTTDQNIEDWVTVCHLTDLVSDSGVCVLFGAEQVAIFQLGDSETLFALSNYDPIGKANVMSRGIIGSIGDELVVASPLYKQHFNLATGVCLEEPDVSLSTFQIRVEGDYVQLK